MNFDKHFEDPFAPLEEVLREWKEERSYLLEQNNNLEVALCDEIQRSEQELKKFRELKQGMVGLLALHQKMKDKVDCMEKCLAETLEEVKAVENKMAVLGVIVACEGVKDFEREMRG